MEAKKKDRQQEQQDRRQEEQDEQQEEKDRRQEEQEEQQELLDYAIEYCTCESYPPGLTKDKKRAVRKKAKSVLVEGGEVYIMKKKKKVKVVTCVKEQKRVLQSCHSDVTSGHFGVTKTWRRVAERFYWRGLYEDAKELVAHCHVCQSMNKKISTVRPELFPVPVKSPWYHLGMDFVGPISPPSRSGNLTISDYFTKFGWAKALQSKEASNVVGALRELFFIMGIPSIITTDQGKEFYNKVNAELMNVFGIDHRLTTAYHPQANGLDERYNQTLVNSLAKYCQTNRETWDESLGPVVYSYNSAVQESTKFTPFEAMFGRQARLPIDINMENLHDPDERLPDYHYRPQPNVEELLVKTKKVEEVVKHNIQAAQKKQKEYYDRKHGAASCFTVGSTVLKKDFRRKKRKGGKLDYRWEGPYTITASHGKGLYQLKEVNGDKIVQRVNGFHLKNYLQSETETSVSKPTPSETTVNDCEPSLVDETIPPLPPPMPPLSCFKDHKYNEKSSSESHKYDGVVEFSTIEEYPLVSTSFKEEKGFLTSTLIHPAGFFPDFFDQSLTVDPVIQLNTAIVRSKSPPNKPSRSNPPSNPTNPVNSKPDKASKANTHQSNNMPNVLVKKMMFKRRQMQMKSKMKIIDVDNHQPSKKVRKENFWIEELNLLEEDREILLSPVGFLTDNIVDAAQMLLKQAFSTPGFQNVCCGLTMNFDIQHGEFVQILHDGFNHWFTVSTVGTSHPVIHVYDSMYSTTGTHSRAQIAALLHTESPVIPIQFMSVHMQAGGCDCGLFAIAFATALALGKHPGQYLFDQGKMRRHLWNCFRKKRIEMFPFTKLRRATLSSVRAEEELKVYCFCRMPELANSTRNWIECSSCKNWYHTDTCVTVSPAALQNKTPWLCSNCV